MDNIDRIIAMRKILTEAFSPSELQIMDDSHKHIGHSHGSGGHFTIKITAMSFAKKSRLMIHREIFEALSGLMEAEIHALSIEASAI